MDLKVKVKMTFHTSPTSTLQLAAIMPAIQWQILSSPTHVDGQTIQVLAS